MVRRGSLFALLLLWASQAEASRVELAAKLLDVDAEEDAAEVDPTKWRLVRNIVKWATSKKFERVQAKDAQVTLLNMDLGVPENETIEMAYQKGRDSLVFTSERIIHINRKDMIENGIVEAPGLMERDSIRYKSYLYKAISAFSIRTVGPFDRDAELILYPENHDEPYLYFEFWWRHVNIFRLQKLLSEKVLGNGGGLGTQAEINAEEATEATGEEKEEVRTVDQIGAGTGGGFVGKAYHWLKNDGYEIATEEIENSFGKKGLGIFLEDEVVKYAFKQRFDTVVITSKRVLLVDVDAMLIGNKTEFFTLPSKSIGSFHLETAGRWFDTDSEMEIYTTVPQRGMHRFFFDLTKGASNVLEVNRALSECILGSGKADPARTAALLETSDETGTNESSDPLMSFVSWVRDEHAKMDAVTAEKMLMTKPSVLLPGEHVLMAFKIGWDMTVFTTMRLIQIDVKSVKGSMRYVSYPYSHIMAYAVQTAHLLDTNEEVTLWTDLIPDVVGPGFSCFQIIFQRGTIDMKLLQKILTKYILRIEDPEPAAKSLLEVEEHIEAEWARDMVNWAAGNAAEIDDEDATDKLRGAGVILKNEKVVKGFKVGRDSTIFTRNRILFIDVKGLTGQQVLYRSIPFRHIRAFAVESAGTFGIDAKLSFWTKLNWSLKGPQMVSPDLFQSSLVFTQKLDKNVDIGGVMAALAGELVDVPEAQSLLERQSSQWPSDIVAWFGNAYGEINVKEAKHKAAMFPGTFLKGEEVLMAFQVGRDMMLFTTYRALYVDVMGLTGEQVEYKSIPYSGIGSFGLTTSKHVLDFDHELFLGTDAWTLSTVTTKLQNTRANIMTINNLVMGRTAAKQYGA